MSQATMETHETPQHRPANAELWTGLMGGPIAWLVHLQLSYMLVPLACAHGGNAWLHATTLVLLAAALGSGVVAWHGWSRAGTHWPSDTDEGPIARSRFIGALGVMTAAISALVIFAQGISSFILDPCWN